MLIFRNLVIALAVLLAFASVGKATEPILILVGLDGLRWDYLEKYRPPNLSQLAAEGVRAKRMIPSFPSLTFPNFYTLATGLYPARHGIVGNSMFDPKLNESFSLRDDGPAESKWWGGEPVWVTAEKQGLRAACMFWPGSEAEIGGVRPSMWLPYSDDFSIEARIKTVLGWLSLPPAQRPRLITLYFHEVDTAGHKFGPISPEVAAAVAQVDDAIGLLVNGVRALGLEDVVNFVIVSDHGMTELSPDRVISLSDLVAPDAAQIDFSGAVAGLRPLQGTAEELFKTIFAKRRHFRVYLREDMPESLHFRDNPRIPPVILIADEGWMLVRTPPRADSAKPAGRTGGHGFDPALRSMGATFIASGPAFKSGAVIPAFENIEVYDFLCATLRLKPAPNDGTGSLAPRVLK